MEAIQETDTDMIWIKAGLFYRTEEGSVSKPMWIGYNSRDDAIVHAPHWAGPNETESKEDLQDMLDREDEAVLGYQVKLSPSHVLLGLTGGEEGTDAIGRRLEDPYKHISALMPRLIERYGVTVTVS